jgi:hypothetical protein
VLLGTYLFLLILGLNNYYLFAQNKLHRSEEIFKEIFQKCELNIIKEATQHGMPEGLFEVKM